VADGPPGLPGEAGDEFALPPGQVYDWYTRARQLHDDGDPAGAVELLQWAAAAEPQARSVREALARALFDARRFAEAAETFASIVGEDPADHYAQFGLGLSSLRRGQADLAVNHLAIAVALRPEREEYGVALRSARAAQARSAGPIPPEVGE